MASDVTVVGLGGSLRARSTSLTAMRLALRAAQDEGAKIEELDIRLLDLPLYVAGADPPPAASEMADLVAGADAMVWSTPLYHGSVSGSFKNAIDWLQLLARRDPPYLTDRVVGLIAAAGGVQGLQAVNTMEFIVRSLRAFAVPLVVPLPRTRELFDEDGGLRDRAYEDQLLRLGREVVRAARQMSATGTCDYAPTTPQQDARSTT